MPSFSQLDCLRNDFRKEGRRRKSGWISERAGRLTQRGICSLRMYSASFITLRGSVLTSPAQQVYASLLGFITIAGTAKWSTISSAHLALSLLAPWALYIYRDIWPLCTFTLAPADAEDGALMWIRIALLTFAAVVIPLTVPRQYTPVNIEVSALASRQPTRPLITHGPRKSFNTLL